MNCIFICVFNNKEYIKLLRLLLESIFIHNEMINNEILIYTNTNFMNKIKQCHLMFPFIQFEINDNYNNVDLACKSRLDLFYLKNISKYEKILYLDSDILIKGDINNIFNLCNDELLYVLEEGVVDDPKDYYGRTLFGNDINNYKGKTAFTSGILLFKKCEKIKIFFDIVREDILKRPYYFDCYDQPYIVYNAFIQNIYNNQSLKPYAVNNNFDIDSEYIIHHFPGIPGYHNKKLEKMTNFMIELKEKYIINSIEKTKYYIFNTLMPIISQCNELIEGNIFMEHHTNKISDKFILKVKNICNVLLNKNIKKVCEIGFNSGFSTLLMLITNPNIEIKCFDLGEHSYTMPCYQMLRETFGDRLELIIGDSTKTLPIFNKSNETVKFDLIHIDGGHSTEVATSDIEHSLKLSRYGTILIMDDYDFENIKELWNKYIENQNLRNLNISFYNSPHQDIRYVCYNFDIFMLCTIDLIEQLNKINSFGINLKKYLTEDRIRYLKNIWYLVNNINLKNIMLIGDDIIINLILILLVNTDINILWHSLKSNNENDYKISILKQIIPNPERLTYKCGYVIDYQIRFDYIFIDSTKYNEDDFMTIFKYSSECKSSVLLIENYKNIEFIYNSYCEFYELSHIHLNEYQSIINKK